MVHSGAIAGAGISQGKSTTMGFDTRFFKYQVGNLADVEGRIVCSGSGPQRGRWSRKHGVPSAPRNVPSSG